MLGEGIGVFLNNAVLSDLVLVNTAANIEYKAHKVIVAAASQYLNQALTQEEHSAEINKFEIPRPVPTLMPLIEDPNTKVMQYIYSNQNFTSIRDGITKDNVFNVYSLAYILKVFRLVSDLDRHIVCELLTNENCANFYVESIRFKAPVVSEACEKLIVADFKAIQGTRDGTHFLNKLPYEYFHSICDSDDLGVDDEQTVLSAVEAYIAHRNLIQPVLDEEDPSKDMTFLTEEERARREEEQKRTEEEAKGRAAEEEQKRQEALAQLDEAGKIQFRCNEELEREKAAIEERLRVVRLKRNEKIELLRTVRYAFLKHEDLLKASENPALELATDMIIEGFSNRLDPYEHTDRFSQPKTKLRKRTYLKLIEDEQAKEKAKDAEEASKTQEEEQEGVQSEDRSKTASTGGKGQSKKPGMKKSEKV